MSLVVGVPTETKVDEFRVAVTPEGVRELEMHGIEVLVEAGAGAGSGLPDDAYRAAGAEIVTTASEVWARSQLVCKVKEPLPEEFGWFRDDLTIFTYLHLAAAPVVAKGDPDPVRPAAGPERRGQPDAARPASAPAASAARRPRRW